MLTLFTTALGRWFSVDAAKALCVAVVAVGVIAAGVLLFNAGGSGAAHRADATWLSRLLQISEMRAKLRASRDRAVIDATDQARRNVERDRDAALANAQQLERALLTATEASADPVVIPKALAEELNR